MGQGLDQEVAQELVKVGIMEPMRVPEVAAMVVAHPNMVVQGLVVDLAMDLALVSLAKDCSKVTVGLLVPGAVVLVVVVGKLRAIRDRVDMVPVVAMDLARAKQQRVVPQVVMYHTGRHMQMHKLLEMVVAQVVFKMVVAVVVKARERGMVMGSLKVFLAISNEVPKYAVSL
jgi:hypothetical protein